MVFNDVQIACHRFGLGAKPDEIDAATKMGAKKFLLQQINNYDVKPKLIAKLPSAISLIKEADIKRKTFRKTTDKIKLQKLRKQQNQRTKEIYLQGALARHNQATISAQSFNERLVYFWQNHFAISADTRDMRLLSASFENEAIRQNIFGKFDEILLAVTKHPAMQIFLDNHKSFGSNSKVGLKRKKGLNENLAREILELHTLGVDNGYSQQDIIAFANMLTGWGVSPKSKTGFIFNKNTHEPKPAFFMGKTYKQKGVKQAMSALKFLSTHKNTADYISRKLAQHFAGNINSALTQELTTQLAESFIKTGGELKELYKILIEHPACWQPNVARFRRPNEWVIAVTRAAQLTKIKDRVLINALINMGQQTYLPGSPAGWADFDKHWNSPSAFIQKWEVAKQLGAAITVEPVALTHIALGDYVDEHTLLAMRKTNRKNTATLLFLLSEQIQYR